MKKIIAPPHEWDCDWAMCNGPCTCGADEALLARIRELTATHIGEVSDDLYLSDEP